MCDCCLASGEAVLSSSVFMDSIFIASSKFIGSSVFIDLLVQAWAVLGTTETARLQVALVHKCVSNRLKAWCTWDTFHADFALSSQGPWLGNWYSRCPAAV